MNKNEECMQLDKDLLEGYLQSLGFNIVKQMFDLYTQQVTLYLNDIETSLLCDKVEQWQEHCHKMKGAAGSVGLKSLHARLKLMEKTTANANEKTSQLNELKLHNQQAMLDFNNWLANI
jgi:HPt (histidine-containing phosphotransfer) domain-containing protein